MSQVLLPWLRNRWQYRAIPGNRNCSGFFAHLPRTDFAVNCTASVHADFPNISRSGPFAPPFIGNLPAIVRYGLHEYMDMCRRKYGKVFKVRSCKCIVGAFDRPCMHTHVVRECIRNYVHAELVLLVHEAFVHGLDN
jgi:hypothetical protein